MRDATSVTGSKVTFRAATELNFFRERSALFQRILGTVCAIASVGAAIFVIVLVNRTAVDIAYWDEWEWSKLIVSMHQGTLTFGDLWLRHNEHRMLFPAIMALGLDRFGGWSQVRECLTSVSLVIVAQFIVLNLLRATFARDLVLPLLLIDSLLLFSPSQSENWTWGFQFAWFLINTAALATIWCLSRPNLNPAILAAAAACAIVAAYSIASGLNVLVAGFIILLFRRDIGRGWLVAWVILSIVVVGLYLVPGGGPTDDRTPLNLSLLIHYFFSYLGLPLGRWTLLAGSTAVGAWGFVIFATSAIVIVRKPRIVEAGFDSALPWLALAGYSLASAGLTAIGRAQLGLEQSLATRYETAAIIFWIATVALCADAMCRTSGSQQIGFARAVVAITLLLGAWLYLGNAALGFQEIGADRTVRLSALSELTLGDAAPNSAFATLYPNTELLRYYLRNLQGTADGPPIGIFKALPFSYRNTFPAALGFVAGAGLVETVAWRTDAAHLHLLKNGRAIPRNAYLEVGGWAMDAASYTPASAIIATVDGRPGASDLRTTYGILRPDVESALGAYGLQTGYRVGFNVRTLRPGPHTLILGALRWDRLGYYSIGQPVKFVVSSTG